MRQRIPTLLAIILILTIIGGGIFIYIVRRNNQLTQLNQINPQEISVANITDTSLTVVWQTEKPVIGKITINNKAYTDDRDQNQQTKRQTHFISVMNLSPETNYDIELNMDDISYPTSFRVKTVSKALNEKSLAEQTYPPVIGTIFNQNQQPVDEALVVIKLPNAIPKATFVGADGSFILPLTKLFSQDTSGLINISNKQPATLEARKGILASLIQVSLPVKDQLLSPVTLGKNENFIDFLSQPAQTPQPLEFKAKEGISYDLNKDGKTNTLDSALISDLITRKQYNAIADFNGDNTLDDQDLELMKNELK